MIINILKKDLKRKKIMNTILFVFITMCTVFLASSINNLMVTMNALDYFSEKSDLSDYFIFATNDVLTEWLVDQENVVDFEVDQAINIANNKILIDDSGYELGGNIHLSRLPNKMIIPLDYNNRRLMPIEAGEIAITFREARNHDIELGDILYIQIGEKIYTFEVTQFAKDMMFFPRVFISDDDFNQIVEDMESEVLYTYAINVDDLDSFTRALNEGMFLNLGTQLNAAMFMSTFTVDLMMMVVLILVSICLIAISFVVLRFAIVFTLQEDYKEIGIMKAIGIKAKDIKIIYLVKYLFLACFGTGFGFILSFPFGDWLISGLSEKIAFPEADSMVLLRFLSVLFIILLILTFCYMSTRKLNKFTAMQAIRSGETGERLQRKKFIRLSRMKSMPTVIYLALNDILSNMKSYVILLVVFTLGFLLVIIPFNISSTLVPEKLAELIHLPLTDVYFDYVGFETEPFGGTVNDLKDEFALMEDFYREHEVELELEAQIIFGGGILYTDSLYDGVFSNHITQMVSRDIEEEFQVLRGTAPVFSNEIALTELLMEELGIDIGDEVNLALGDKRHQFVVTGSYQTLAGFGLGAHLSQQVIVQDEVRFGVFIVQGNFVDRDNIEGQIQQLKDIGEESSLIPLEDFIDETIMDVSIIDTVRQLILVVVLLVNGLVIVLMSVSFMMRDLKQMALIKSLGFRNQAVKLWQGLRICFIMMISLGLGMLLVPGVNILATIPFAIMGTPEIALNVDVIHVYVFYPTIFLVVTGIVLIVATLRINKVGIDDMKSAD
jgi:putative ABC transport system permease protein